MYLRPDEGDLTLIGFYLGRVVFGLGLVMALPAVLALVLGEWNSLTALALGAALCVLIGSVTEIRLRTREQLAWSHAMVIVALAWLLGALLVAVPLYLSGHFGNYLDAVFEGMSGLTTSGLSLTQDLDHLSRSMNLYRHVTQFAGGQGIVIVVLSLFAARGARVGTLYVSEARDERIMPNFIRTARFIFLVAGTYLLIGTVALTFAIALAGVDPLRAVWHAANLFMAGFDTGGFSPQSTSIAYYHSFMVEAVLIVVMIAGTVSFGLHFQLWRGDRRELFRHLETRTLAVTLLTLTAITLIGLARSDALTEPVGLLRKGFFTVISAHSGTGFSVSASRLFVSDWGTLAPAGVVGAMALGGMASSTAGGIKAIRVGLTVKAVMRDIRRVLLPESALVVTTYHSQKRRILRDDVVRGATTILLLYTATYLAGTMVGLAYGRWDVTEAIFESVSATANVGLSVGIIHPDMPVLLEITYILQMWLGRLEFLAVFASVGYLVATFRSRA